MQGDEAGAKKRPWSILVRTVIVGVVIAMQWSLASLPAIDTDDFDRFAVELTRTATRRYGYLLPHHGAVLVMADIGRDTPIAPPRADDQLAPLMAHELRWRTPKAVLELVFYAVVFAAWRYRRRWIGPFAERGTLRYVAAALRVAVVLTILLLPYVIAGYGEPLLNTRQGPGALSSSGPVPATGPIEPAISYGLCPRRGCHLADDRDRSHLGISGRLVRSSRIAVARVGAVLEHGRGGGAGRHQSVGQPLA